MAIIKQKSRGLLVVVSGPSGAGKDTVVSDLLTRDDINAKVSVSMTSRQPRGSEEEGKDYYFVSKEEFDKYMRISSNQIIEKNVKY